MAQKISRSVSRLFHTWQARSMHRRCMAQLDAHLLMDIGLTTRDQLRETEKPMWRA
ncbi:uncharacterized protein DUF1127 [Stella humosa]|uniref:Uncharacterized protein DUF1127 n=1 Tax=Stella humosa TaxID=94 RepID=A0A3N1M8P4_9PROT|nr:DUF1127 domain-containing protein [Stella humosa]ROP99578.1 uncharacterized protein DUF1127 [Stella humosa]BBK31197.1 hypothetical protein STHU_18310 [Stella humosa]